MITFFCGVCFALIAIVCTHAWAAEIKFARDLEQLSHDIARPHRDPAHEALMGDPPSTLGAGS